MQPNKARLTTEQLAAQLGVKSQTIRKSYCISGHYLGLRPTKLPNRFLLWQKDDLDRLLDGLGQAK